ncbi:isochorismatase family protein [Leifsonia sp. AG29]|uniref:isochorismatase family protein n=1 Tax=Leifsonia sp. AG29 TaxID=2598860 RepID=UPI00131E7A77|nr:isochorismatase family protein [Leifsonia sp. AG29]
MGYGLMLVGAQRARLEGADAVPGAESLRLVLGRVLEAARAAGAPIVHVKNDGTRGETDAPGTGGWELVFAPEPGEPVVRKSAPNTFESNPALADVLRAMAVDTVVVVGVPSEGSVRATALGALERGFDVIVPTGAHAAAPAVGSPSEVVRRVERELSAEGVEVIELDEVRFD